MLPGRRQPKANCTHHDQRDKDVVINSEPISENKHAQGGRADNSDSGPNRIYDADRQVSQSGRKRPETKGLAED